MKWSVRERRRTFAGEQRRSSEGGIKGSEGTEGRSRETGKSDPVKGKVEEVGCAARSVGIWRATRQSPEAVFVPQIRAWRRQPGPQSWRGGS